MKKCKLALGLGLGRLEATSKIHQTNLQDGGKGPPYEFIWGLQKGPVPVKESQGNQTNGLRLGFVNS